MKTFLALLIVALAAGAGYEYYLHDQQATDYIQQRSDLTVRISELKKKNKDLADEEAVFTEKLTYLEKQAADLQTQIAAAQGKTNAPPVPAQ
jgi:uncharacterized protein HemX